jgi:predicted RNA-binding protein with PIN domain
MEIIIDGYNLIGSDAGLRGNLEPKRRWLVQQLGNYQNVKGYAVTVVFDGWRLGLTDEVQEKRNGVTVVYSRRGEEADSVVVRRARKAGSGCVVVTSDREVRNAVERFGAVALYAGEFNQMLRDVDQPFADNEASYSEPQPSKKGNPRRLSKRERKRRDKLRKLKPGPLNAWLRAVSEVIVGVALLRCFTSTGEHGQRTSWNFALR